ncbi:chemotaxis protein CheD [Rubricella aquisinus]|uniref:Probable chemoreceptor glutamine deamidase CheD n=1 Tax=Rubricella aquisinus TaxID=2028108 RepID=A0A840WRI8_9RHOB|nr:chemotaxis protein CheD [Rubricella aquisinus]MBB5516653.1 chemotaxis protein CheD [Rubricella aquisinus]
MTQALKTHPYFDARIGMPVHTVLPGDHLVLQNEDAAIMTLLGSCVAACIRDPLSGAGGLNHFLLPDGGSGTGASARYGVHAMELLINALLRRGSARGDLEAKVFGGGNVMDTAATNTIGARNAEFVRRFLKDEGIKLVAEDLGGSHARRVVYIPKTGRTRVQVIAGAGARRAGEAERSLERQISQRPRKPQAIELF